MGQVLSSLISLAIVAFIAPTSPPRESTLVKLPWEIREQIIRLAFTTDDELSEFGPTIRMESVRTTRRRLLGGQVRTLELKWQPSPHGRKCTLARVCHQLNRETEHVVFSQFIFLFVSGFNKTTIEAFINKLSPNAKAHFNHFMVYFGVPIESPWGMAMAYSLYARVYDEMRPTGFLSVMWEALPNVKKIDVLIEAANRNSEVGLPSGEERLHQIRVARGIWTFLTAFQLDRDGEHAHVPPVVVNIIHAPDNFEDNVPRVNNITFKRVMIGGRIPTVQIDI